MNLSKNMNFIPLVKILIKFLERPVCNFKVPYNHAMITKRSKFKNSGGPKFAPWKIGLKLVKNLFSMISIALILPPKFKPLVIMVPLGLEKYQKFFFKFLKKFSGMIGHA